MNLGDDITWASTTELGRLLAMRAISAVELVEHTVARIEATASALNAVTYCDYDGAREIARESDERRPAGGSRGPLDGIPVLLKDLGPVKRGWVATEGGIPALRDRRSETDCLWTERAQSAGAIPVAATNSPSLGVGALCDNALFGATRNPFDVTRNSGGSSGGSAAAVASGVVSIAQASDGGGSARIPAAWCGLFGYKPSFGTVPFVARPNAFGFASPFVFNGAVTRTVSDAVLIMNELKGADARDPYSVGSSSRPLAPVRRSVKDLRVGVAPGFGCFPVDGRIRERIEQTALLFESAGAIVDTDPPALAFDARELAEMWTRLVIPMNFSTAMELGKEGHEVFDPEQLPPYVLERFEEARHRTVMEHWADEELRTRVFDAMQALFERYDVILSAPVSCLPVLNDPNGLTQGPSMVDGEEVDPGIGWCPTFLGNLTGHPSASVPMPRIDGLPVGVQVTAALGDDNRVLETALFLESAQPWDYSGLALEV